MFTHWQGNKYLPIGQVTNFQKTKVITDLVTCPIKPNTPIFFKKETKTI
jgi:hypothetical protein